MKCGCLWNNIRNFARVKHLRSYTVVVCCLLALSVQAQEGSWLTRTIKAVGRYIDSSSVKGIDNRYIVVPKYPWQIVLKYNINKMDLKMNSHFNNPPFYEFNIYPRMDTRTANNVGLWIGYRGYGIGYSVGVRKQAGTYFTAGVTGSSYGLNLRLRTFRSFDPSVSMDGYTTNDNGTREYFNETEKLELEYPIRVRTLIIDGYYLFNGKHFSYMAAYDQSAIQVRSAGSLMVGAMYHNSTIGYNDDDNAPLLTLMHDIGVLKIRQASLGAGYAYNWVPVRGLLVSAFAMPMLTFYNRQKVEWYNSEFDEDEEGSLVNGRLTYRDSMHKNSEMTVNFNARLSLTYNFERVSLNVYGQWNQFRYDHEEGGSGRINDWFVNTSLGVRF